MKRLCALGALAVSLAVWSAPAAGETQTWEFTDVTRIQIEGVSGNVLVRPHEGSMLIVELDSDVTPERNFEPEVEQDRDRVQIEENWRGGNSRGHVEWTILVPEGGSTLELDMDTASGDIELQDVSVAIDFDTASGDARLINVELGSGSDFDTASGSYEIAEMTVSEGSRFDTASGDFELLDLVLEDGCRFSTASGDVNARRCQGYFELSTASGDVDVRSCDIAGVGEFSTASGDVSIDIDRLPAEGLLASSASGNVRFSADDFGDEFRLVMIKREDRGRISCPFDYTEERTFREHRHEYEEKVVERGSGGPEIELRTASGKVIVKN